MKSSVVLALGCLAAATAAWGQTPQGPDRPPAVDLDKLLELPNSLDYSVQTRGGETPGGWRARFRKIRDALEAERNGLRDAQARLEETASNAGAYQIAPPIPGLAPTADAPLDFQLRSEINRHREEIEHLERRLQELEIEANLAGVPEDWRD